MKPLLREYASTLRFYSSLKNSDPFSQMDDVDWSATLQELTLSQSEKKEIAASTQQNLLSLFGTSDVTPADGSTRGSVGGSGAVVTTAPMMGSSATESSALLASTPKKPESSSSSSIFSSVFSSTSQNTTPPAHSHASPAVSNTHGHAITISTARDDDASTEALAIYLVPRVRLDSAFTVFGKTDGKSHVVYQIFITQKAAPGSGSPPLSHCVFRRYNNFVHFNEQLNATLSASDKREIEEGKAVSRHVDNDNEGIWCCFFGTPSAAGLPILPGKEVTSSRDIEFYHNRCQALQRYLQRLLLHRQVWSNISFNVFLGLTKF